MFFFYEFFRKTKETYICSQIFFKNKKDCKNNININISYLKHMIEQVSINSFINININLLGDKNIDYHHSVEDVGIILGKLFKYFIFFEKKFYINRYGFFYVPLDDALSRVIIDICGRPYLNYNIFYYNLYIKNFNINLFYDFFLSFSNNSNWTIYIDNLVGFNLHHIFESVFKAFGRAIKYSLKINLTKNSSKKILF